MYLCNIIRLGVKTKNEFLYDKTNYIKKLYNKLYVYQNGCIAFDNNLQYIDYNDDNNNYIIINLDTSYKKINEFFYNNFNKLFVLNYGFLGENITLTGIDYLNLFPGIRLAYKNIIFEVVDYVKPDERLNIFPLKEYWWKNYYDNKLFELIDIINFPGICGFYVKIINDGFINI